MYLKHFGLTEMPFGITPDTSFTYLVQYHQEALNTLLLALNEGEGFVKISGEVGTGKTLLCRRLLQTLDESWVTAYLPNPNLAPETLLSYPVESSRLDVVRQFLQPAGLQAARIRQGDNTLMLVQMAAAGWGVTVLPSWVSREFEQQGLVVSRPLGSGLWRRLYGAMRLREKGRPDLRRLLEQVQRSGERRCPA